MNLRIIIASVLAAMLAGCAVQSNRADRLMAIAAEETGAIKDPADRLTRLLNLAELQTGQGYAVNARKTLARAADTISTAGGKLSTDVRMAGWVSISELSRRAGDLDAAGVACDNGLKDLRAVQTLADRCPYVRGLADEVRVLRGKSAAASVLKESTPWVAAIEGQAERRRAATAIASDLFQCDDYDGGKAMLQAEPDAAWRVDTLIAMANREAQANATRNAGWGTKAFAGSMDAPVALPSVSPAEPAAQIEAAKSYGNSLSYEQNFQRQQLINKSKSK